MKKQQKKLEVGGGQAPQRGYIQMDVKKLEGIDVVGDVFKLPFKDNELDEIYGHWIFEHFAFRDIPKLLKEWMRALKPGGLVRMVTNNQEAHNRCFASGEITWKEWVRLTYGLHFAHEVQPRHLPKDDRYGSVLLEDCHKVGWNDELIREVFTEAGFDNIETDVMWKCREDSGRIKCPGLTVRAYKPK